MPSLTATSNAEQSFLLRFKEDFLANANSNQLLPSVRELSQRYRISPVTITRGLKILTLEGKILTKPGAGTFVAEKTLNQAALDTSWQSLALGARVPFGEETQILMNPPRADYFLLGGGYPDERLQPHALLNKAATAALRRGDAWTRSHPSGLEALRIWFARELSADFSSQDVLIAPGGQAAVAACLRALIAANGTVLMESPTYFGALAVARSSGFITVPVPIDQFGVRPDWLESAFSSSGARVAYLQPTHHNPTGAILSPERRKAVLEVAAKFNAFIIEDDYAQDFTLSGTPPRPLILDDTDGRVICIRSLTKASAPSMRVAAIIARGAVRERLRAQLAISEMFTPLVLQITALELVSSAGWGKHLKNMRQQLRSRRDSLIHALEQNGFAVPKTPNGGFGIWLPLPSDDLEFTQAALQLGVQLLPGKAFFPAESNGNFARVSYAAADENALLEAAKRLGSIRSGNV